jgi:hypothetical protein
MRVIVGLGGVLSFVVLTVLLTGVVRGSTWSHPDHDAQLSGCVEQPTLPLYAHVQPLYQLQLQPEYDTGFLDPQPVIGPDLSVYYVSGSSVYGMTQANDASYTQKWQTTFDIILPYNPPTLSPDGSVLYLLTGERESIVTWATNLTALSTSDGRVLWSVSLSVPPVASRCGNFNNTVRTTGTFPLVISSGLIIVTAGCGFFQSTPVVLAFKPQPSNLVPPTLAWYFANTNVRDLSSFVVAQAPLLPNTVDSGLLFVLFVGYDKYNASIMTLDPTNGTLVWRTDFTEPSMQLVGRIGGFVVNGSCISVILLQFNPNVVTYIYNHNYNKVITLPNVRVDAVLSASDMFGVDDTGSVYRWNNNGKVKWRGAANGVFGRVSVDGNEMVYVSGVDMTEYQYFLTGLSASTGMELWAINESMSTRENPSKPVIVGDGSIFLSHTNVLSRYGSCSLHGTSLANGSCLCNPDFWAADCSIYCNPVACSARTMGRGTCGESGCACGTDYYPHNNCSVFCNRTATCSDKGNCNDEGQCVCDPAGVWDLSIATGSTCSQTTTNGPLVAFVVVMIVFSLLVILLIAIVIYLYLRLHKTGYQPINI